MKLLVWLYPVLFCLGCARVHPTDKDRLKESIVRLLQPLRGDFALVYQDLNDGDTLMINEQEVFHAASTMKTPVMMEVFHQAAEGLFDLYDSVEVKTTFTSIYDGSSYELHVDVDSDSLLYQLIGKRTSIYFLVYQMITKSSNLATNMLIELTDARKITAYMRQLGADSIQVLRGVEDLKAFDAGMNNTTTALDLDRIFYALSSDSLISNQANRMMLDILLDQEYNEMFPAHLPDGTPVAHKTGWITGVYHDSGIIYLPDGTAFILVFLSKNASERSEVLEAGASIARLCYDYQLAKLKIR